MEKKILVGMPFNNLSYARSEQAKHAEVNDNVLKQQENGAALCEYNKDNVNSNPISVSWNLDRNKDGIIDFVQYQRYDTDGFMYRGIDSGSNFNEIYDHKNNQVARDLNGNGIVDKGEIFDHEG